MSPTSFSFVAMTDAEARETLLKYGISLTVDEARKVEKTLGRPLSMTEAVIWGIQGSEHCSYKSSRKFLSMFPTNNSHVILGPKEDSGIVALTDGPKGKRWGIVVSHESHNHPSQIVPFEGAATGIGGCVRDVLCMGARVIGCMDALRLGDLHTDLTKDISKEVMRGIAGYGNPLGIPNLGGDAVFDATYNANCLVNAVTFGLIREDEIIHSYVPDEAGEIGYDIILVGKPTDRSGFGGASFASATLNEEEKEENTGAVQEPNPFLERHLLASTYDLFDTLAREKQLKHVSFKDLGAGGVVCASVEQVAPKNLGAEINLDNVHVSIDNLPPEVIGCAETQERFCWMCHPKLTQMILDHYNKKWDLPNVSEKAAASLIGKVINSDRYVLKHQGKIVCDARSEDITSALKYNRPTEAWKNEHAEPQITIDNDYISLAKKKLSMQEIFEAMLRHPSYTSQWPIYRGYDKTIIGNTIIERGEGDAGVIAPLQDLSSYVLTDIEHPDWKIDESEKWIGAAVSVAGNGRYGRISPYLQGVNAAVQAMRSVAAVGATPRALSDCLNYGNPEHAKELWSLEQGIKGIADAAKGVAIGTEPVAIISGNVSLYNSLPNGESIDPTAIVSCIGAMPDARKAVTMQLKESGSRLYFIGTVKDECGASAYYQILEDLTNANRDDVLGSNVPSPDFAKVKSEIECLASAMAESMVLASHAVDIGGLALALFEMTLPQKKAGGTIGVHIDLRAFQATERSDVLLFSESGGYVVEISQEHSAAFEKLCASKNISCTNMGNTIGSAQFTIMLDNTKLVDTPLSQLHAVYTNALGTLLK